MPEPARYAAIDLGATSGRVVAGRLAGGRIALEDVHRFPNRPVRLPDGLHWNLLHLFAESLEGLRRAGPLRGVGIDTWGVDYALLDARGRVLGLPFHYRDERTAGMVERAFGRVPQADLYAVTGIQTLPINTVFQLLADEGSPALAAAQGLALVPDLLASWLCGERANERTNASTTGLLDARSGEWAHELIGRLGLPARLFGALVEPGTALGPAARPPRARRAGRCPPSRATTPRRPTSRRPCADEHAAILSSGTWSLLGLELPEPVLSRRGARGEPDQRARRRRHDAAAQERDGHVAAGGVPARLAATPPTRSCTGSPRRRPATPRCSIPTTTRFLAPGDMPARIAAACERTGQAAPAGPGAIVRSILVSLACKYRWVLERLEAVSGRDVRRIHVIGGGARNALLCRLTADITGREVLAGPVEATALGNVLVQARAAGELGSLAELRAVAAASAEPVAVEPSAAGRGGALRALPRRHRPRHPYRPHEGDPVTPSPGSPRQNGGCAS